MISNLIEHNLDAKKILKAAGLYVTPCRLAILKTLIKAARPLNKEKISSLLGRNVFDKVTVYRTLESFCRAGFLHKAYVDKRAVYFELAHHCGDRQCHPHFTCTNCGRTHCMKSFPVPEPKISHNGFIIHRQQIRLEGLCPDCRTKI